jgi:hypothetical protein
MREHADERYWGGLQSAGTFSATCLEKKKAAGVKLHPPAAGWNQVLAL